MVAAAFGAHAVAQGSPRFIEYVLRAETSLQSQTNPLRLSYDLGPAPIADTVRTLDVSGAAIVPLGSEETRLLLSGSLGSAVYQKATVLDPHPHRLDAALQWRLGDLLRGSAGVGESKELNQYLGLSAPNRDLITNTVTFIDVGLRITDSLTLPVLSANHSTQRYEFASNASLYNRDEDTLQLAARYNGIDNSYMQAGVLHSQVFYRDRTPSQVAQVDNRYTDQEVFVEGLWTYSIKTSFSGRLGLRNRSYANLSERDVRLLNASARADWQYSPKTLFKLDVWNRPYANQEVPTVVYSTLTGARAAMRWQATEKQWYSLSAVRESQQDTRTLGEPPGSSWATRIGARMEFALDREAKIVLDGWRENVRGINAPSLSANVLRLSLVLSHDNGGTHAPERLLRSRDCAAPRYVETTTCYD